MVEKYFHLKQNNTTTRREVVCGVTTFLTMMYILFANSSILSEAGMPWQGVFMATALISGVCTILAALYTNLPFALAPGMGLNTVFTYTLCIGMGYHWQEALAISFLAGLLHMIIMSTPLRKAFVNAFPDYLRVATGAGLGMFIAYIGLKNAGILIFNIHESSVVPGIIKGISPTQLVAVIGLAVMVVLTAIEKKTGERYAALPLGILVATFLGIPLKVTVLNESTLMTTSMFEGFGEVFLSFFGEPGILSIFANPALTARTLLMVCVLSMTSILDSVGAMIGIGQIENARLFDEADMEKFKQKGRRSKLDRALITNSLGNTVSPMLGCSPATIFLESITGIVSGGRTGLTGLITGIMFLLCLPIAGFFKIIPSEAVAPALILAGVSMLTRMRYIDWKNFEQCFPAFITILVMPLAYSILDGIAIGILSHVVIQTTLGKRREVHPILFVISVLYIAIMLGENVLLT